MKDEYDLYGGVPPHSDDDTSLDAAESIRGTVMRRRAHVLAYIKSCSGNGTTDDEIEVALGYPHQSASARRRELVLLGLVCDSGLRRRTRSGRRAKVWLVGPDPQLSAPKRSMVENMPTQAELRQALAAARSMYRVALTLKQNIPYRCEYACVMQWLGTLLKDDR